MVRNTHILIHGQGLRVWLKCWELRKKVLVDWWQRSPKVRGRDRWTTFRIEYRVEKKKMSHMNTQQRGSTIEENFSNQVDRMTCSVDVSASFCSYLNACSVAQWKGSRLCMGSTCTSLTKLGVAMPIAKCLPCQQQRLRWSPLHRIFPRERGDDYLLAGWPQWRR